MALWWFPGYSKGYLGDWIIGTKDNSERSGLSKWKDGVEEEAARGAGLGWKTEVSL